MSQKNDFAVAFLRGEKMDSFPHVVETWPELLDYSVPITLDDIIKGLNFLNNKGDYEGITHWAFSLEFLTHTYYYPTSSPFYTEEELLFINSSIQMFIHSFSDSDITDVIEFKTYVEEVLLSLETMKKSFNHHEGFGAIYYTQELAYLLADLIEMKYIPLTPENAFSILTTLDEFNDDPEMSVHFATLEALLYPDEKEEYAEIEKLLSLGTALPKTDAYYRLAEFNRMYSKNQKKYSAYLTQSALLGNPYAYYYLAKSYLEHNTQNDKLFAFKMLYTKLQELRDNLFNPNDNNFRRDLLKTPIDLYAYQLSLIFSDKSDPEFCDTNNALAFASLAYYIAKERYNNYKSDLNLEKLKDYHNHLNSLLGSHYKHLTSKVNFKEADFYFKQIMESSHIMNVLKIDQTHGLTITFYTPSSLMVNAPKDGYFDYTHTVSLEFSNPLILAGKERTQLAFTRLEFNPNLNILVFKDMHDTTLFSCQGKEIKLIKKENWDDILKPDSKGE